MLKKKKKKTSGVFHLPLCEIIPTHICTFYSTLNSEVVPLYVCISAHVQYAYSFKTIKTNIPYKSVMQYKKADSFAFIQPKAKQ